jgi:hypothetical protein
MCQLFDTFLNPRSMKFKLFYQIYIFMILLLKFFISSLLRIAIIFFIDFLFPSFDFVIQIFFWFYMKKFIGKELSRMIFNLLMEFGSWFATKTFYQFSNSFHIP